MSSRRPPGPRLLRSLALAAAVALLAACASDGVAPVYENGDPAAAEIVTSDLVNFWQAIDARIGTGSTLAFQRQYLDRGSPGLEEFAGRRGVTADRLAAMVDTRPRYVAGLRASMLEIATGTAMKARLHRDFARFEQLYPEAVFPPVTLLVGRFSSGGTIGRTGVLIGSEFYTADATTPLDELGYFERTNVRLVDSLPFIVVHELVHIQQAQAGSRASQGTLLEQALMEGSADFVGELVSGGFVNGHIHEWALPHEAEVWADFRTAMNGTDVSLWLYNQGSGRTVRPGDLGYFVGYRIAKSYYDRQANKRAALRAIIRTRDAAAFLAASGYDPH